jgi:alanine-synthesizing transaminase
VFSSRLPAELVSNRLSLALEHLCASAAPVLDLTGSNPTTAGFSYPDELLAFPPSDGLPYEPHPQGLWRAREAVAADFARRGIGVRPERIVLTASTSEAYSFLFKLLCDPFEEVLVPRPGYPLFEHLAGLEAVVIRPYWLEYHGVWSVDIGSLEYAATPQTRAVVTVNPNNPTGSFLRDRDLAALVRFCAGEGLALIGDEVFVDYKLEPTPARPPSVLDQIEVLTFTLGGLSKSVGLPQMKLGWIAVGGPDDQVEEAIKRLELLGDTYLSVGTPVQNAAGRLLVKGAEVRQQVAARVGQNHDALAALVGRHPSCRLLHCEGGWSAVVQVPAIQSEESLVLELLEEDRVLVHPGYFFDFPNEAFLVMSLLTRPETLLEGARRVLRRANR